MTTSHRKQLRTGTTAEAVSADETQLYDAQGAELVVTDDRPTGGPVRMWLADADSTSQVDQMSAEPRGIYAAPTDLDDEVALLVPKTTTVNGHALSANVTVTKSDVGLSNVTNDAQLKAADLDDDTTLAANSATKIATQHATKAYIDLRVTGVLRFINSIDCSANPNYPAATKGDLYVVTVAGKIGGASGDSVDVGDEIFAIADNAGGTKAAVGSSWDSMEHNLVGALLAGNNLSDVGTPATARTNLGLGSAATHADTDFDAAGAAAAAQAASQPLDSDLTTIAGLTPTTDNFMQAKSGAWASRTVAQVKSDLGLSGTNSGDQTITLTGDVTGSGTGSFAATIANDAVTYAKMQNVSATDKLLGRATAGAGDVEEIACTAAGRALIDDADATAQRATLGLVIGTNVQAWDADLDTWATKTAPSGTVVGTTDSQTLTNKTLTSPAISTPTGIVKGDVGLGNVDNTSDATKNSATATVTNKRNQPRVNSQASTSTLTPEIDTYDVFRLTALAANLTIANHSTSTPADGEQMRISILDNGGARTISFGTNYVARAGVALPTTTTINKLLTLGFEWYGHLSKWVLLASGLEA